MALDIGTRLNRNGLFGDKASPLRIQNLPFLFEYTPPNNGEVKRFILPLSPEKYRVKNNYRASTVQTKDGIYVDNTGNGYPTISMSGTFGMMGSLPGGPALHIESKKADAWTLMQEMDRLVFFEFYKQFGSRSNPTVEEKATLIFFNFTDNTMYEVIINPFIVTRSMQRRGLYEYSIEMEVVRDLLNDRVPEFKDIPIKELSNLQMLYANVMAVWSVALQVYSVTTSAISDILNLVDDIKSTIDAISLAVNGFNDGITALIDAPYSLVEKADTSLDAIIALTHNDPNIPHEFLADMRGLKRDILKQKINKHLYVVSTNTNIPTDTAPSTAVEIMTVAVPTQADPNIISSGETPETTLFSSDIEEAQLSAVSIYTVTESDTIETIAAKTLGDAKLWRRIAFVNDIEPPFIAKKPQDRVSEELGFGQVISINNRIVRVSGPIPSTNFLKKDHRGKILLFINDTYSEVATIASITVNIDQYDIEIEELMDNVFVNGDSVTLHDHALSVIQPSEQIKIPKPSTNSARTTLSDSADVYERIFGADEYVDDEGRQTDPEAAGATTIKGIENLKMQLRHELKTQKGELAGLGHPEYGCLLPTMIGKVDTQYWIERVRMEIIVTALKQAGIDSVESVAIDMEGTTILADINCRITGTEGTQKLSLVV